MDERFDESYLNSLPPLTPAERAAMESCDMTPVLGTTEERLRVAMNAAIRFMRERDDLRKLVEALDDLLACYRLCRHPPDRLLNLIHDLRSRTRPAAPGAQTGA